MKSRNQNQKLKFSTLQRILAEIPPPLPADLVRFAVTDGGSEICFSWERIKTLQNTRKQSLGKPEISFDDRGMYILGDAIAETGIIKSLLTVNIKEKGGATILPNSIAAKNKEGRS